ncbi:MAG TPA: HAMP domain-containing sensor histidine kinase [Candidatus Limnocylindria bacterium]|nr:HAMP domain-containing sensor histidine kinase [Candidatus Limnocylindria bacterium]
MSQRPRGRGGWDRTARPPWWPESEPFPPARWRHGRARFRRRFAVFALVAFLVAALVMALLVATLVQAFAAVFGGPPHPVVIALAALFVLFALTAGTRSARRIAGPLGDLVDAAERIESGDYSVRVRVRGPRSLRAFASAFNSMSARLERSETERRRLLADVTHELRTPLTVMQGNIEALIDGVHPADAARFEALLEETRVLSRLIDDLRTVSLAEAGALALHREATDLGALVRDTAASFEAQATSAGVRLQVETDAAGSASVDPIRVREMLTNVVANALRYTPPDGTISLRATGDAANVTVSVKDTGPGIAADVLPHVFERFTRSAESPGAGLGLAIAKSLVTAHGGTIEATSASGKGTEIVFTLPRRG